MNVWTKYVFPSLRIVIWAAIAVALIYIAFFSNEPVEQDPDFDPGSNFTSPTFAVTTADIVNNVNVPATVVNDPAREAKSEVDGYVGYWAFAEGAEVSVGQAIVEIRRPVTDDPDGAFTRHTLNSPIAGILHRSEPLNADVMEGDVVFTVTPTTMSVEGDLSPQDRFRLLTDPTSAEITLEGGPAPFTCEDLTIGTSLVTPPSAPEDPDQPIDPFQPEQDSTGVVKMTCPAPADVRLFPGLTGTMSVPAGEAHGVLAIPVTAVQGVVDTGRVWVVDPATGAEEEREIALGLSDGEMIEVTDGLEEGEEILQFAPGNLEPLPEDMIGWETF